MVFSPILLPHVELANHNCSHPLIPGIAMAPVVAVQAPHGQPGRWRPAWTVVGVSMGEILGTCTLVNSPKKRWKDPPCYSWVNQLFRLGHFLCRKLLVYQRVYDPIGKPINQPTRISESIVSRDSQLENHPPKWTTIPVNHKGLAAAQTNSLTNLTNGHSGHWTFAPRRLAKHIKIRWNSWFMEWFSGKSAENHMFS